MIYIKFDEKMSDLEKKKGKAKNYSKDDDYQLVKSWKLVTTDSIHGTDQSGTEFWSKIRDNAALTIPLFKERTLDSLRQRFGIISRTVSKFVGVYASIMRLNQSGTSTEDKFEGAVKLFKEETQSSTFKYRDCWELLKDMPKFSPEIPRKRSLDEVTGK